MEDHLYTFKGLLEEDRIREIATLFRWGGDIKVEGQTLRSQRPIPPRLHHLLASYSRIATEPVYAACQTVYQNLLDRGKEAFSEIDEVFLRYGYIANIVLAETIAHNQDKYGFQRILGKRDFDKLLQLLLRRELQPSLFPTDVYYVEQRYTKQELPQPKPRAVAEGFQPRLFRLDEILDYSPRGQ